MRVESALDQPFLAEIELIDAHDISLSSIKVGLAEPQSYRSLGVELSEAAGSLFFDIKKNKQGKTVVEVHSAERMTEPYMQLIVDLIWSKGQIYKVYTVLLDPPGYKLANTMAQSGLTYQRKFTDYHQTATVPAKKYRETGHTEQKKKVVYGPTLSNENVWQIAQRYKTPGAILPQIVLAIVGSNPDAFIDGNLNGLKTGVRLKIPSDRAFFEVPSDLATVEVMAHDKAWNEKTPINHVLAPPYITGQASNATPVEYSQIPPVPKFADVTAILPNQKPSGFILPDSTPSLENQKQVSPEQSRTLKAEISITTAAVDSLRESNALLTEQLGLLQAQNKKLQKQLDIRDKELQLIRNQLQTMMKERIAIAGQASSMSTPNKFNDFWILFILLLVGGGGSGVIAYYYFKWHAQRQKKSPSTIGASTALIQPIISPKKEFVPPELLHEVKLEAKSTQSELKTKPKLKSEPELKPEPKLKSEPELKPKPKLKSEPKLKPKPKLKSKPELRSEPELKPESELKVKTELQFDSTSAVSYPSEKMNIESGGSIESTPLSIEPQSKATDEEQFLEITSTEEKNEPSRQGDEDKNPVKDPLQDNNLLEFETGLHHLLAEKPTPKENNSQDHVNEHNNGLDFTSAVSADLGQTEKEDENKNLSNLKNQKALDTLLALARTYIGMEDIESALHSLNDVMEHGNKSQKEEAQRLIDEIQGKS